MSVYPHRIRLRGPWDCKPLYSTILHPDGWIAAVDGPVPPPCKMAMPCRWAEGGLGPFNGRVRFRRRFHKPRQVDAHERLWLTFAGADYFAEVSLNGEPLGEHEGAFDPFEFDITSLIRPANELVVEVDLPEARWDGLENRPTPQGRQRMIRGSAACPPASGGLWGTVALEVRREAFLQSVRLWATFQGPQPTLHVAGEVAGKADRPLELYVLLDGRTVLYEAVSRGPFQAQVGCEVELWQPLGLGEPRLYEVQIDLIDGASKLHTLGRPFGFREIALDGEVLRVNGRRVDSSRIAATELLAPVQDDASLHERDGGGGLAWMQLPFAGGYAGDQAWRRQAVRQAQAIVGGLQHHPSVAGWICHRNRAAEDAALDDALVRAVKEMDPTRLFPDNRSLRRLEGE